MKPFTIETPVLGLKYLSFQDWSYRRMGRRRDFLSQSFFHVLFGEHQDAKAITLKFSSRRSKNSVRVFIRKWLHGPLELATHWTFYSIDPDADAWLRKNTPLGTLKPGESATVYVTLYVHGE